AAPGGARSLPPGQLGGLCVLFLSTLWATGPPEVSGTLLERGWQPREASDHRCRSIDAFLGVQPEVIPPDLSRDPRRPCPARIEREGHGSTYADQTFGSSTILGDLPCVHVEEQEARPETRQFQEEIGT